MGMTVKEAILTLNANIAVACERVGFSSVTVKMVEDALATIEGALKAQESITGETSDGYHTFNELYHHRAVLFSVIVANYKDRAWKSVRHHDGTMYDGMFIVGIDTPDGQATYHYDIDPYWDMFDCKVREFAPEWDGHSPAQAIERIGKLKAQKPVVHGQWINIPDKPEWDQKMCSVCGDYFCCQQNYCPNCGAKMDGEWRDDNATD